MAPAREVSIVQVVRFTANDRCTADPTLFQAVRDMAHGWQERGLKSQYWGTSVTQADEYFWLLIWQSHAHATAVKTDPSYPIFVHDREALASKPVYEVHVAFSGNPQRVLEAPVTEIDLSRVDDVKEDNPDARPAAETQELIRRITYRIESMQMQGFIALSWGVALEDGTRGVYLGGWRTIEDHMRLGTLDEHKVFVEETEEIFKSMTELYITYVHFKSHNVQSSA